ncbi:hypothetical protein G9P44_005601 [Scheffersomyces stipitis]|nr:hypothetical protein G9P44_005601 [Scheffersomyces stipitis]
MSTSAEEGTHLSESTPLLTSGSGSEETRTNPRSSGRSSRFRLLIIPTLIIIVLVYATNWYITSHSSVNQALPFLGKPLKLRVYTNNIRLDNRYPVKGEQPWSKRKKQVINSIDFNTALGHANVVCLQEVLHNQLVDILEGLNKNAEQIWTYYGVGRNDGLEAGEYAPILYKHSDWILLDNQTFWLSETPWKPSKGWDAALERIVTMVTLESRINPLIKVNVFNTHFDHRGVLARKKSAELIVDKMENFNDNPSFLCGDFNTQPKDQPYHVLSDAGFKDSRKLVDYDYSYGHSTTFTGFNKEKEDSSIIDYIWSPYFSQGNFGNDTSPVKDYEDEVANEMNNYYNLEHHLVYDIVIKQFGILHNYFKGFYFSDHRPVVASYEITRTHLL